MEEMNIHRRTTGTPQGGVISPLLANLFLHVVFDKWMDKHHPEKPFERYADDVIVHCKTEKQALFMMRAIEQRTKFCKLTLHPDKTKIVNIARHFCESKVQESHQGEVQGVGDTQTEIPIEELAQKLNPIIRGLINYYHKFWQAGMRDVWNGLNHRLLKWVKWEKGLYKYASVKWLKQRYTENPGLFVHWKYNHNYICLSKLGKVAATKNMKSRVRGDFDFVDFQFTHGSVGRQG